MEDLKSGFLTFILFLEHIANPNTYIIIYIPTARKNTVSFLTQRHYNVFLTIQSFIGEKNAYICKMVGQQYGKGFFLYDSQLTPKWIEPMTPFLISSKKAN